MHKDAITVAAILKRKLSTCKKWKRENIVPWVQWFCDNGRCFIIRRGGQVTAVALVRCLDTAEQAEDTYFDNDGQTVYVDATVATDTDSMKAIFTLMWLKFGQFKARIAWSRSKNGKIVIKPMNRAFRRLSYGQT